MPGETLGAEIAESGFVSLERDKAKGQGSVEQLFVEVVIGALKFEVCFDGWRCFQVWGGFHNCIVQYRELTYKIGRRTGRIRGAVSGSTLISCCVNIVSPTTAVERECSVKAYNFQIRDDYFFGYDIAWSWMSHV